MKKRTIIISLVCILLILLILYFVFSSKVKYTIKVSLIDDYSPDRILTVYNEKNEKVDIKRIELDDGTILCKGYNTAVHFVELENRESLKVILQDDREVTAKIIK